MNTKKTEIQPGWINKSQMAASLGISTQAFEKWGVQPVAKIGRESFFRCSDVVENRVRHREEKYKPELDPDLDPNSLDFQRLRLTKEQADNMELKNEQARAKLVPIELMTRILARIGSEWAALVDALPLNIKRKHPGLDGQTIEDIKRQCVRMQNAVARLDEVAGEVVEEYAASIDAN